MNAVPLISKVFTHPEAIRRFSASQWQELLHQGYASKCLAKLYSVFTELDLLESIPETLRWHFSSASQFAAQHKRNINRESQRVHEALSSFGIEPVLLKGGAYLDDRDKCGHGRVFSDLDIFVPRNQISMTEKVLHWHGWSFEEKDEYDLQYYHKWMHELPPMVHNERHTALDVHHNLLPLTCRLKLDADLIYQSKVQSDGKHWVLSREDRVLHSLAHLLLDSEFNSGYRDMTDIYQLLNDYQEQDPAFINRLQARASKLKLDYILALGFELLNRLFDSPTANKYTPSLKLNSLVVKCFTRALQPTACTDKSIGTRVSIFALFVRGHWLKMPVHILVPHLLYKSIVKPVKELMQKSDIESSGA